MMKLLLLLLSFISTGVNGDDGVILAGQLFDISVPCEDDSFCFHVWQLSTSQTTSDYIAIVSNGAIRTDTSEDEDSKCSQQISFTEENVGSHHCQQRPDAVSPHNASSELKLMPGKTVSLQCVVLSYVKTRHCYTQQHQVSLTWVDEADADIQQDSQYQIKKDSPCDITLTVTLQSPDSKKFRCQATVGEQVHTSVEIQVKVPGLRGRGRRGGITFEQGPENQEKMWKCLVASNFNSVWIPRKYWTMLNANNITLHAGAIECTHKDNGGGNQDAISAAVGVVGCLVVTALVALFVVNKRRTRSQLPDESCYTTSTNNVMDEDDVIYCEIIHPVSPDRVWVHEDESTVYACVR